ncbi:MAG TPA: hypothetical protein VFE50_01710 [Cyclobacteriaceae bacterium]|nr:hypothetical protein [Cyclobacteriaceae bacterium]
MKAPFLPIAFALFVMSCQEDLEPNVPELHVPETTKTIKDQVVLKVLPHSGGWVSLTETLQPQYLITQPKREISWMDGSFSEVGNYKAYDGWSLLDAVVHPSGQVSAVSVKLEIKTGNFELKVKMLRFSSAGSVTETEITQLPNATEPMPVFPGSLDRVKLVAHGEDVYAVVRWRYNEVQAQRMAFEDGAFKTKWQSWVEPPSYVGTFGIIGGGYDNFHQGDRYFFVYADVDKLGNLYVAVPCHEETVYNHDDFFKENLMAETNPGEYDWGVAIVTRLSPDGKRVYSKLHGKSRHKRLLNMRVTDEGLFFTGRIKVSQESDGWDAWVFAADLNGNVLYDNKIDVRAGDMFWDVNPLPGGNLLAVGTTDYYQNPAGLSVSDARRAAAFVVDVQGKVVKEIILPQGPAGRGSEAMFVKVLSNKSVLFAGAHNAPGTHASVYSDGFIAVRDFSLQNF